MNRVKEWLENKGHYLMPIFIVCQIIIFVILIFFYFFAQGKIEDPLIHYYSWTTLSLFMCFMIHFAYH